MPSDPAQLMAGPYARSAQIENIRRQLGLDQPLYIQFIRYTWGLLHGDLGISLRTHNPIIYDLSTRLPATLELVTFAMILTVCIGIPLGVISATDKNKPIDHFSRILSLAGLSLPIFWFSLLLQLSLGRDLGIFPVSGRISLYTELTNPVQFVTGFYSIDCIMSGNWMALADFAWHIMLPALALMLSSLAIVSRMMRSSMLETLSQPYIVTVRAFGLRKSTITYKYALKNALIPTLTAAALAYGYSIVGDFVVETIFDWPGVGSYAVNSLVSLDFPAILGTTLVVAMAYIAINLIVDFLYVIIDPRIRYG